MNLAFFVWVYLPTIVYILMLPIIYGSNRVSTKEINLNLFWIIQFPIEIILNTTLKSNYVKHLIVTVLAVGLVFYYLFLDFSCFFPQNMKMTVHFNDKEGIETTLQEINVKKINGLIISPNDKHVKEFFQSSDSVISHYLGYKSFYYSSIIDNSNTLEINGNVKFIVKETKEIQKYRIESSSGWLWQKSNVKDQRIQRLKVYFEKIVSQNDEIKITGVNQIYEGIIISPVFNQYLVVDGRGTKKFEALLYGITKVNIFPDPTFSNTLYLIRKKDTLVPIGYAKYYDY